MANSNFPRRLAAILSADVVGYARQMGEGVPGGSPYLDRMARWGRRCERSPVWLPWFDRNVASTTRRLHAIGLRSPSARPSDRPSLSARTESLLALLCWPFVAALISLLLVLRNGRIVHQAAGVPWWRQLPLCLGAAFGRNVPPSDFFILRLYKPHAARHLPDYLLQREKDSILRTLQPPTRQANTVNNKIRFFEHCRNHAIPTPPIIASFSGNGRPERWHENVPRLPDCDLFRKPFTLSGGRGAERWTFSSGEGARWRFKRRSLDAAELLQDSRSMRCIIQPALSNHEELRTLAPHGLATLRVITLLVPGGQPQVLGGVLRIPVGRMWLDNYSAGGLVAGVELQTGQLKAAVARDVRKGEWDVHPDTKQPLKGRVIPQWQETLQLALRAHQTLPELTSVGWDMAVTDHGIVVVEANVGWNFELIQLGEGRGLGETIFRDWAAQLLRDGARPQPLG